MEIVHAAWGPRVTHLVPIPLFGLEQPVEIRIRLVHILRRLAGQDILIAENTGG